MIEKKTLEHHIQKYIIGTLMHDRFARFRDMRPPKVDTNLYSYHLKLLQKRGFVDKTDNGYTLGREGILFVDRVSTQSLDVRTQPKIITMQVIWNSHGDILLYRRKRQPFTERWTLPYGKLHIEDVSILAAAQREAREKLGIGEQMMEHAGDCYIRIIDDGEILMSTLTHVFRFACDDIETNEHLVWVHPSRLSQYDLAPAVEQIVARTFSRDPYFFEEFDVKW